jgi:hypothetical protein
MAPAKKASDPWFDRQYRVAVRRGISVQPRAVAVRYDVDSGHIEIGLDNGAMFAFPAELGQGLRGATVADLEDVEIVGDGSAIHWERLDVDYDVTELLAGLFGTRAWMRELGRLGGRSTSAAKARRAREWCQRRSPTQAPITGKSNAAVRARSRPPSGIRFVAEYKEPDATLRLSRSPVGLHHSSGATPDAPR